MNATVSAGSMSALAGALRVVPAAPLPLALQSSRRDWAPKLAVGRPAVALPGLMASVFNLCSHAHRVCAQLALSAAQPDVQGALPTRQIAQRLRTETAQEHIRRIGLDWPRLLGTDAVGTPHTLANEAAEAQTALQRCPLLAPSGPADPWVPMLRWLQNDLLHMPAATWLAQWQAGGGDWLQAWASAHNGWLAKLVRGAREFDDALPLNPATALRLHAQAADMRALAAALCGQPGFALSPQWQGACAHTGNWARLYSPAVNQPLTPWALLGSRVAELVRLCLPDEGPAQGAGILAFGTLQTGEQQGLAWVEMARGLLVHRVELDTPGPSATVRACNVLAPTEWNFHPHGFVAQHISRVGADEPAAVVDRRVRLLMAAFDPCVPFDVVHPCPAKETFHA